MKPAENNAYLYTFFTINFSFHLFCPAHQLAVATGFSKSQENKMINFVHLKQ